MVVSPTVPSRELHYCTPQGTRQHFQHILESICLDSKHDLEASFREDKYMKQLRWQTYLFKDDVVIPWAVLSRHFFYIHLDCKKMLIKHSSTQAPRDLHAWLHCFWHFIIDFYVFISCWLHFLYSHIKWFFSMAHSIPIWFCGRTYSCVEEFRKYLLFLFLGHCDSCSWICLFLCFFWLRTSESNLQSISST